MKPLYEYTTEYKKLIDTIEDIEDITVEQQKELLDSVKDDFKEKAFNVSAYIKNLQVEQSAMIDYIKQMDERLKKTTSRIESLKEYLKYNMNECGIDNIVSPQFSIKIKNNPCKVYILDETKVEDIYIKEKVVKSIDKEMIKSHLKNGVLLDYAILVSEKRIEIK